MGGCRRVAWWNDGDAHECWVVAVMTAKSSVDTRDDILLNERTRVREEPRTEITDKEAKTQVTDEEIIT